MYTKSHNEDLLKEIDNKGGQFTGEEHAYVIEQEFAKEFESKESVLRWEFSQNPAKLSVLAFLMEYINKKRIKNIISLGAGSCTFEYLLKYALPEDSKVIAADFDSFFIEKAKIHFSSIIPVKFDFFTDDIGELQTKLKINFDIAVFFSSSYVMDDSQFIHLFRRLKEIGVKQIIDFHAGYVPYRDIPRVILRRLKSYIVNELRKIEIMNQIKRIGSSYSGKFHGYARTRGELERLYKKAGVNLIKRISVDGYKYIAICNC